MAEVAVYHASVQVGDSAKRLGSFTVRVSASSAKAYVAAADAAARAATVIGILLDDAFDLMDIDAATGWKKYSVESSFISDAFAFPASDADLYLSNKWKITYATTNAGIPVVESIYMPVRATDLPMESNGINLDLTTTAVDNFIAALILPGLSSFGTAITEVLEITVNDV
jgi:hypothetical protein